MTYIRTHLPNAAIAAGRLAIAAPAQSPWNRAIGGSLALLTTLALLAFAGCSSSEVAAPICGKDGTACCAGANACDAGLGCSASICIAAPFVAGAACTQATECASAICGQDGLCAAASCTDAVRNGDETDVDCSGSCPGKCGIGQTCSAKTDCARGTCLEGVCAFEPGGLLGPGGASTTVAWTQIAGAGEGMKWPSDLAFSLDAPEQLWVVDRVRDAMFVITDPGTEKAVKRRLDDISQHFLEEVVAISFDGNGTFGTCGDTRNAYGGMAAPNDFMGPVQWPSDLKAYPEGKSAHEQHWDMLHSTPNCAGLAAMGPNQFFCFNGLLGCIDWYDFHLPHVPGGDDHSDGEKRRYIDPTLKLKRVDGVPSNLVYDWQQKLLYIADSGNGRILRFSAEGATKGKFVASFPQDGKMNLMEGFSMDVMIDSDLTLPTGLALHEGTLYVADRGTGLLHAYDLSGKRLRSLDTGLGADRLGGLEAGPDDRLYFVDTAGKRAMRVETSF